MHAFQIKLVVFSVIEGKLKVFVSAKLLPVGVLGKGEALDEAAKRIFSKVVKLHLRDFYIEQLYTFSSSDTVKTDICITYFLLLPEYNISSKMKNQFVDTAKLTIVKSEKDIVAYAIQRLGWKIEYTNVVYSLLPPEFTLSELQKVYEAILRKILDKRNFRKKVLSLGLLKDTGKTRTGVIARPAKIYSFITHSPQMIKIYS